MTKRQKVSDLWKLCFDDTEEFIRFYFDRKYNDENALVYEEEGRTLAALQMLPYPMTWEGTEIMTSYISGACTSPKARNKGYMKQLLIQALLLMRERHLAMSTLIPAEPWLFDYYSKFGYATVFDYSPQTYTIEYDPLPEHLHIISPECYEEETVKSIFTHFDCQMRLRSNCIQHDFEDFLAIVQDIYVSGGRVITLQEYGKSIPVGIALAYPISDKCIKVSEMIYNTDQDKQHLLQSISTVCGNKAISHKAQVMEPNVSHLGMARVTDVPQMLEHYASTHPEKSFSIEVIDSLLPENKGIYLLDKGNCSHPAQRHPSTHVRADIPTLTQALLGYRLRSLPEELYPLFTAGNPYMSLMLD